MNELYLIGWLSGFLAGIGFGIILIIILILCYTHFYILNKKDIISTVFNGANLKDDLFLKGVSSAIDMLNKGRKERKI